jgi:cytoskeletal protein CcmA (bactofilin family)
MNKKIKYLVPLMMLIVLLAIPGTAMAKGLQDDRVVAGGTFTLESDQVLDGNLIIFGGTAAVQEQAFVEGDVVVLGGIVTIDGVVEGNVVGIGGVVNLNENAFVEGDLTTVAATLNREPGAEVRGQVITGIEAPVINLVPGAFDFQTLPNLQPSFSPAGFTLWRVFWFVFRTLMWGALAAFVAMFLPNPTTRTSQAIAKQPAVSGGVGLITIIITPIILLVLAITCILSPISLVGLLALVIAWFFGRIAIGLEIGLRMAKMFDREWPLPVAAGIGTFSLALVVDSVGTFLYCVGWLLPALVGILGLGGVVLTYFGTREYPPKDEFTSSDELPPPSGLDEAPAEALVEGEGDVAEASSDDAPES